MIIRPFQRIPPGAVESARRPRRGWMVCLLIWCCALPAFAVAPELEAKVKAAYVYHFIHFVEWPREDAESKGDPIRIGVLGADPVGGFLEELSGRQVRGRTLQVERITKSTRRLNGFHILFISRGEQGQLAAVLQQIHGARTLTVSDIEQFSQKGGMIGFFQDAGRIRIEVCMSAIRSSNIKLSARLLEVVRVLP